MRRRKLVDCGWAGGWLRFLCSEKEGRGAEDGEANDIKGEGAKNHTMLMLGGLFHDVAFSVISVARNRNPERSFNNTHQWCSDLEQKNIPFST